MPMDRAATARAWSRKLQEARSVPTTATTQSIDLAMDLGAATEATVQFRVLGSPNPDGTLWLEHAPVLEESAFEKFTSTSWTVGTGVKESLVFTGLHRYIRWTSADSQGAFVASLDVVARQATAASSAYFLLQSPTTIVSTNTPQRISAAIDILGYRTVTVRVKKLKAGTGDLYLQHAPVLDEDAFEDVSTVFGATNTFDLATPGNETLRFTNLLRYLRWRGDTGGGPMVSVEVFAHGT